ncbi:MAG: acetate--CoA ligase family protein [Blastococcus sp.]
MTSGGKQGQATPLMRMLRPRSVALVGVSGRADSLLARPLRYLREQGFAGEVYPVNPRYEELDGRRCYASLAELPSPVDLVLVMVPAAQVPGVVREAGAVGAAAAIVFASGFAETGPEGAVLQEELRQAARESGVRVLGPNCQGLIHASTGLCATFTQAADRPMSQPSGVAYVGQSGAVGGSILDLASEMGLGLSAWVSTGNQADLDLVEVASVLVEDDDVSVLMLYVEAMTDGAAYRALAERARDAGKSLVVLRAGRSQAGRRAVASHTGAMLADDTGFVLTSRRHGVYLVEDVDDLLNAAAALAVSGPVRGRRVGVVTTSGGAGGLAADRFEDNDLAVPELSPSAQQALAPLIPAFGALANPVDVTAQLFNQGEHAFGEVCRIVADDPGIDAIAVLLTMVTGAQGAALAEDLVKTAAALDKPLYVVWLAGRQLTVDARRVFADAGVPVFGSIAALARVLSVLATPTGSAPTSAATPPPWAAEVGALAAAMTTDLGPALLDAIGIARPRGEVARTADEAAAAASRLGVTAMKVYAPALAHKSDVGGVLLDVPPAAAGARFVELLAQGHRHGLEGIEGIELQQMVPRGVELILGAMRGSGGFPPLITVGLGGVTTELYRDVVSAVAPVNGDEALAMLQQLRGWPLLAGFRGQSPADVQAAVDAVVALSWAIAALESHVAEIEVNPLIVARAGEGAVAVDVLVR